jgi:hypothetical protein
MWRIQLFNYVAFTIALISLDMKSQLSSFNRLAALHLTYINLVSALTGSLLVYSTYFAYYRPRTPRRGCNIVVVYNIIRALGGIIPVTICMFFGYTSYCLSQGQVHNQNSFTWITLFTVHVGEATAFYVMFSFAFIVTFLHIAFTLFTLIAIPDDLPCIMGSAGDALSRFINGHKRRLKDIAFVVFMIYLVEEVVAIERSLVLNFGKDVITQNDWGFGQVSMTKISLSTVAHVLCHKILSFVLLYPALEALWWNVVFPLFVTASHRTGAGTDPNQPEPVVPTSSGHSGGGHGEAAGNQEAVQPARFGDDEKDITELTLPRWNGSFYRLSTAFNGSAPSLPTTISLSAISLSSIIHPTGVLAV